MPQQNSSKKQTQLWTRRTFLQRAVAISSGGILLPACAGPFFLSSTPTPTPANTAPVILNWISEGGYKGDTDTYRFLVDRFNALHPYIQVQQSPGTDHDKLTQMFKSRQANQRTTYDILSIDVVWMSEFASREWIVPLDVYWSAGDQAPYLSTPRAAASYNGRIWGAPLHTDIGVLYYRTDFSDVIKPEQLQTWDDLERMAKEAMVQKGVSSGFSWQGAQYEGLVCNFVEFLSGYGGKIFDSPQHPMQVLVNSPEGLHTLNKMVEWVQTISPGVQTYKEHDSTIQWISGQAAFMRNWPGAVIDSIDHSRSKVVDRFDVIALPSAAKPCLGGWQLAINSFSSPDKREPAWEFIWWMLQEEAQRYLAVKEAFPVTLASIYENQYINTWNPYYSRLKSILNNAQFRPITPHYHPCVTQTIWTNINQALTGTVTPAAALQKLEVQLQRILALKPADDCNFQP